MSYSAVPVKRWVSALPDGVLILRSDIKERAETDNRGSKSTFWSISRAHEIVASLVTIDPSPFVQHSDIECSPKASIDRPDIGKTKVLSLFA